MVIVFVCLAIIAIAATRLFANLNMNMLGRMQVYRGSRLYAVNSPSILDAMRVPTAGGSGSLSNPTTFLDFSPQTGQGIVPGPPGPRPLDDRRLPLADQYRADAETCMSEMTRRISDANTLAQNLTLVPDVDAAGKKTGTAHWEVDGNPGQPYIDEIRKLCSDEEKEGAIWYANEALNNYTKAKNIYKNIVDEPYAGGFYEWDQKDLDSLAQLVDELDDIIIPQLSAFVTLLIEGNSVIPLRGLNYISAEGNLGDYACVPVPPPPAEPTDFNCLSTDKHTHAVDSLLTIFKMVSSSGGDPTVDVLGKVTLYCTEANKDCCETDAAPGQPCVPYTGN